jgi:hypothetical protein
MHIYTTGYYTSQITIWHDAFSSPSSRAVVSRDSLNCNSQSKSKSHCDWRSVSKSWRRAPSGAHDHIFITVWQLWSCSCGAPSLTREQVCLSYMLLALASAVFLGSKSLGTRYHILLSQIRDFLFVVSYDSQGHGGGIRPRLHMGATWGPSYIASRRPQQKSPFPNNSCIVIEVYLSHCCLEFAFFIVVCTYISAGNCLPTCCLETNVYSCSAIPASERHGIRVIG